MHDRRGGETSEAELIRRAAAGDHRAFDNLIRRVDRRVLGLALRFTGSNEDAQDIYQEVFIRVFSGLGRFRGQSEFSTWVHRIAVNVCMTHLESRKRRAQAILPMIEGGGEAVGESQSDSPTPESQLLGTETRERIRDALLELPPRQRMVFALRHYEGYRLREIAIMMGCREGTVKRYLFEATRTMRDRLEILLNRSGEEAMIIHTVVRRQLPLLLYGECGPGRRRRSRDTSTGARVAARNMTNSRPFIDFWWRPRAVPYRKPYWRNARSRILAGSENQHRNEPRTETTGPRHNDRSTGQPAASSPGRDGPGSGRSSRRVLPGHSLRAIGS